MGVSTVNKHKLLLEGLNCAHCAGVIEEKIGNCEEYDNVSFNFVNKILTLESQSELSALIRDIQSIVDSVESGVTVKPADEKARHHHEEHECECGCHHEHHDHDDDDCDDGSSERQNGFLGKARPLAAGAALFAMSLVVPYYIRQEYTFIAALILQIAAVLVAGYAVFFKGLKNILKLRADENFLLFIAVAAAFCIGEGTEAVLVTLMFVLGNMIEDYAVDRSRNSIKKLASIRPDTATVLIDGEQKTIPAGQVKTGDTILVAPHERIPVDAVVTKGSGYADCSAITGESVPVEITEGTVLLSGSVNGESLIEMKTVREYSESAATRIIKIVEEASAVKGNSEKFITKFAKVYTPIVIAAALLITLGGWLLGVADFKEMLYRGLVVLVASCPCAVVISVPLGFYSGIGAASRKGVLIKGSKYLEALAQADCIAFDKTGTLTTGEITVNEISIYNEKYDKNSVLSLAAACEKYSSHPYARAVVSKAESLDLPELINYNEIAGRGVTAVYDSKKVICGSAAFLGEHGIMTDKDDACLLAVDGELAAGFTFSDSVREDAHDVVNSLRAAGFKTVAMLTGDKKQYADSIAKQCGIDKVYAELLPQDKVSVMSKLSKDSKAAVFVGDGINDAPILAEADCGIAMGLGSEAAIEAADAVLSDGMIKRLPACIKTAKRTMAVIKANIAFAVLFKVFVLILAAVGIAPIWLAVVADTGVSVACILNSTLTVR